MKKDTRPKFKMDDDDWDEEDDDEFDEGGGPASFEVDGVSYAPMHTGLVKPNGEPILRHPVVMRFGFHPARSQYHAPTLEENDYGEEHGRIEGWVYD